MAAEKIQYRRLPGKLRGIFHTASLWLGDDHLLAVSGWRFTEDYKRFYYRDIQAVVMTYAPRFVVPVPWLLAVLAAGITALFASGASVSWLVDGCIALLVVLGLYLLIVNLTQSCRCRVQTAVSREELPSLYRMWTARKALAILERRIAEVQGTLVEGWTASVAESPAVSPEPAPPGTIEKAVSPRRRAAVVELALYASLVLGGAWLFYRPQGPLWMVALAVQTLLGVGVLIDRRLHGGAKSAAVLAVLVMILAGGVAYADNLLSAFRQAEAHPRQFNLRVDVEDLGKTPLLNGIYAGSCLALAATGALAVVLRRKE
jgi:hypothetical protein